VSTTERRAFAPHPYQRLIIDFMVEHRRCNVFAGMGMGKTVAGMTVIDACNLTDGTVPTLVLGPKRVAQNVWPREAQKWEHLRNIEVAAIVGSKAAREAALRADVNVWTVNYDNVPWLIEHYLANHKPWPFKRVLADESTRLKSFRTRQGGVRAGSLGRVAHTDVDFWTNFTGTPSPNGIKDLWGQQWFVDRGAALGKSFEAFKMRWFQRAHDGYNILPTDFAQDQVQDAIRHCTIALDARDWFNIEEPLVRPVYVELPSKARSIYRQMEREMYAQLERDLAQGRDVFAVNAAARTSKCLQIANGAVYYHEKDESPKWAHIHDEKLDALESIVEEAGGAPVLCAYQWKHDAQRILKAFPKALDISTDHGLRAAQAGKGQLWLAHPASMGHGIDGLQDHCNILAFFGHWWNLEEYMQIVERVGPMRQIQAGKNRPVWIYPIIARDTVDDDVMVRRATKQSVQDILLANLKRRHA
jgi:hypothetical protein